MISISEKLGGTAGAKLGLGLAGAKLGLGQLRLRRRLNGTLLNHHGNRSDGQLIKFEIYVCYITQTPHTADGDFKKKWPVSQKLEIGLGVGILRFCFGRFK